MWSVNLWSLSRKQFTSNLKVPCAAALHTIAKKKYIKEVDMQRNSLYVKPVIWNWRNYRINSLLICLILSDTRNPDQKRKIHFVLARLFQLHTPTQLDGDLRSGIQVMSKYYHCCWHIKRFRSGSGLTWFLIMCDELSTPLHIPLYFTFVAL